MAMYDVPKIKRIAKKNGIRMTRFKAEMENSTQRIYDFDLRGTYLRRVKFVTFKKGRKLFPNTANVYEGNSKYGIEFNSYEDLIRKIKEFDK